MSTVEPPAAGEPTPPPPANPVTVPPPEQSMAPPPPPPAPTASMPAPPAAAAAGLPRPGELLDRGVARFVDGIILGIVFAIINAVAATIVYNSGVHSTGEIILYYAITGIVEALLGLGYFGYMESSRGQTLGKMVMKLQTF